MTLDEAARGVREAMAARDRAKEGARAALRARAGELDERYWQLEQRVDRLEERLLELLREYFAISERVRASPGGDAAIAFESAARRWLSCEPGVWIAIHRGDEVTVVRGGRAA